MGRRACNTRPVADPTEEDRAMLPYPSVPVPSSGISRRVPIRLSIERPNGKRRSLSVEIDRCPGDSDRTVMEKASTAYRAQAWLW